MPAIGAVDAGRVPFGEQLSHPCPEAPPTEVLRVPTYASIAGLPLLVERCELQPLVRDTTSGFTKVSTVVRLSGGSHVGEGEDVTWDQVDQIELLRGAGDLHWLHGERTLDGFASLLGLVNLFPRRRSARAPASTAGGRSRARRSTSRCGRAGCPWRRPSAAGPAR